MINPPALPGDFYVTDMTEWRERYKINTKDDNYAAG